MKVIGKGESGRLIVEVHKDELLNVCGYRYIGIDGAPQGFDVGMEIQVSKVFYQIERLINSEKRMKDISKNLHGLANDFEANFDPIVNPQNK